MLLSKSVMLVVLAFCVPQHVHGNQIENTENDRPTVVWLRPPEVGMRVDGVEINDGPLFKNMSYLASYLLQYTHRFEAYPIKRAWAMISTNSDPSIVYCFFGASYREDRLAWGYFSEPTSINLPLLMVTSSELNQAIKSKEASQVSDDEKLYEKVSLQRLLEKRYKTVLYNDVKNAYSNAVKQWGEPFNIVTLNGLGKDLGLHTIDLIETGRIDFGYVGHKELNSLTSEQYSSMGVYQISELSNEIRGTKRLFCAKTELGKQVTESLNQALLDIKESHIANRELREINFVADGYPQVLKPIFNKRWEDAEDTFDIAD